MPTLNDEQRKALFAELPGWSLQSDRDAIHSLSCSGAMRVAPCTIISAYGLASAEASAHSRNSSPCEGERARQ